MERGGIRWERGWEEEGEGEEDNEAEGRRRTERGGILQ